MNSRQIIKDQIRAISFILIIMISVECSSAQTVHVEGSVIKAIPFNAEDVVPTPSLIKLHEDLNIKFMKSLDADRLLHNFKPEIVDEHYYRNAWEMEEDAAHYDNYDEPSGYSD